jgi:hypothetical protein
MLKLAEDRSHSFVTKSDLILWQNLLQKPRIAMENKNLKT